MTMKNKIIYISLLILGLGVAQSCNDLDLNPLSSASSENWYSNADEITMSLNEMYRKAFYPVETDYWTDRRTDDWAQRDYVYEMCNGSTTSALDTYSNMWTNTYKAISRCIRVIESIDRLNDPSLASLRAEALFFRAYFYGRLVNCWGDAPFYLKTITTDESFKMGRTDKDVIKEQVYKDFDEAIAGLPVVNNNRGTYRVTKGAALALKARFAIRCGDYAECAARCKDVMDLKEYALYPSYGGLFRDKGYNSEVIFSLANSYAYDQTQSMKAFIPRTAGGTATAQPSWDLLAAYECTDGKTINESPLFDPHDPYANRDPRCNETFVAPGTEIYGVVYNPHTSALKVYDDHAGKEVKNKDTKANDVYAAYNGCCLRKGAQPEWRDGLYNENPQIIIRYADVLLMYAESMNELGKTDASVLDAVNEVRARAYGVKKAEVTKYPAVDVTDQAALRKIIRRERRVEFAWEGLRYFDLKRWGLLEKAYSTHYYGLLNKQGLTKYVKDGNWFWPETPVLDEDGFADFSVMYDKGLIEKYGVHKYDSKVELFPIPNKDILINKNLEQNPGY